MYIKYSLAIDISHCGEVYLFVPLRNSAGEDMWKSHEGTEGGFYSVFPMTGTKMTNFVL